MGTGFCLRIGTRGNRSIYVDQWRQVVETGACALDASRGDTERGCGSLIFATRNIQNLVSSVEAQKGWA